MKVRIFEQNDVPLDKNAERWIHFVYIDSSGWVALNKMNGESNIQQCKTIIAEMEYKSGLENGLDVDDTKSEIDGYNYTETELPNGESVIIASPYRGEETIFLMS